MAIYHCSVKVISRSTGSSAVGAAAYRSGQALEDERVGVTFDYTKKRVEGSEIIAPNHAPAWVHDRAKLWNYVEACEKRKDAQLAREVEVSIPRELSDTARHELVRGYVKAQFVEKGMVADVSFHMHDKQNPHAHILLTMRNLERDGFGKKTRDWNTKEALQEWRQQWEQHANSALERAQYAARIDHRSNKARGLVERPTLHMGVVPARLERAGIRTAEGDANREVVAYNQAIHKAREEAMAAVRDRRIAQADRALSKLPARRLAEQGGFGFLDPVGVWTKELEHVAATDIGQVARDAEARFKQRDHYTWQSAQKNAEVQRLAEQAQSARHWRFWSSMLTPSAREAKRQLIADARECASAAAMLKTEIKAAVDKARAQIAEAKQTLDDIKQAQTRVNRGANDQVRKETDTLKEERAVQQEAVRRAAMAEAARKAHEQEEQLTKVEGRNAKKAKERQKARGRQDQGWEMEM